MIRLLLTASLLMITAPANAEKIRLSLNQALAAAQALGSLDQGWRTSEDKQRPFELGGALRLKVAYDIRMLTGPLVDFRTARQAVMLSTPGAEKAGSDAARKFNAESDQLSAEQRDFDLEKIDVDDLHVGDGTSMTNPIPVSTLAALGPVLMISR